LWSLCLSSFRTGTHGTSHHREVAAALNYHPKTVRKILYEIWALMFAHEVPMPDVSDKRVAVAETARVHGQLSKPNRSAPTAFPRPAGSCPQGYQTTRLGIECDTGTEVTNETICGPLAVPSRRYRSCWIYLPLMFEKQKPNLDESDRPLVDGEAAHVSRLVQKQS
jgi:hypothetical protein